MILNVLSLECILLVLMLLLVLFVYVLMLGVILFICFIFFVFGFVCGFLLYKLLIFDKIISIFVLINLVIFVVSVLLLLNLS